MATIFPLRYSLPTTMFTVTVSPRIDVVSDESGSRTEQAAEVMVTPEVVADPLARCVTTIDIGLLEKTSLSVALNDDGVIESLGADSERDVSAVISLTGKVITLASVLLMRNGSKSLEEQWAEQHKTASGLIVKLSQQVEKLLG